MPSVRLILRLLPKITLGGITLGLLLSLPTLVQAQTLSPFHLSISPSVVELAVQPGKTVTQAFLIENEGTVDLEVTPSLRDFSASDLSGKPQLSSTTTFPYAQLANSEIQFDEPFILPAGTNDQFVLHLAIPEDAQERDWYLTLLASTKPNQQTTITGTSNALTQGTIGANVLIRITQENLVPLQWGITLPLPKFIDSLQKIEFEPVVSNKSTTYATPQLTVTVLDWRRQIIAETQGLPERILAHSQRRIPAQQVRKDDPRSQEGVPFRFAPRLALGPYTIRASIANSTGGPTVVEHQIVAFPFSILAAGLGLGFVLSVLRFLRRQRLT